MNSVSLIRLFDLMQTGIYSGCVAIITDEAPTAHMMNQLSEKSLQHFRSVTVWNLSNEFAEHALHGDTEMLLVYQWSVRYIRKKAGRLVNARFV